MPTKTSLTIPVFTSADLGGRTLFRTIPLEVDVVPGTGRLWLDLAGGNGADASWQRHLQNLAAVGRAYYDLPWDHTDLQVSCRGRGVTLSGASASLPLFVAWVARLSGTALPDPFFATGVAEPGTDALTPAPQAFVQGKLDFADAYVRQALHDRTRVPIWVPAGSSYNVERLGTLDIQETPSLRDATLRILGVAPRPAPGAGPPGEKLR